ncbi:MAG: hypothetical protein LBN97_06285 [Oscillospiraceae bacterium]|nr:hypothetical protein [Oscillospiraceae bacterium]
MQDLFLRRRLIKIIAVMLMIGLFLFANMTLMIVAFCLLTAAMLIRTVLGGFRKRDKLGLCVVYGLGLALQIVFTIIAVIGSQGKLIYYPVKLFAVLLLLLPFFVEQFVVINKNADFYLPSIEDISTITFAELRSGQEAISNILGRVSKAGKSFTPEKLKGIFRDLRNHSATQYVNNGTLTDKYMQSAYRTLDDPHIYLAISNTGSAASEIISVFTQKLYNHASISFDRDLNTIISYNGGANVYPPGMNPEMLEFFHQKKDASILIYSLETSLEQKKTIIDKISDINKEGSAYNIIGLVIKRSIKPNIMFCSQFVYKMLEYAGLQYFENKAGNVRPTDLIEMDYYKKLKFEYEIKF